MTRNQYLTANGIAKIISQHLGIDLDDVVYQWLVEPDGAFDGILIRTTDAEVIAKIDAVWKSCVDRTPAIGRRGKEG